MKSTKDFFNSHADKWDEINIYKESPENFRKVVSRLKIGSASSVVDLGCGTGVFIPYLLEVVGDEGRVYAVDSSDKMIEKVKEKFNVKNVVPVVGDAENLSIVCNNIDAVLCFSVFPHFDDRKRAVAEIAKVLKPKGRLVIAHFSSRDEINAFHASLEPPICNHYLPDDKELAPILSKNGMVLSHYDNKPGRYELVAYKN